MTNQTKVVALFTQ